MPSEAKVSFVEQNRAGTRGGSPCILGINRKRNPTSLAVNHEPNIVSERDWDNYPVSLETLPKSWLDCLQLMPA